MGIQIYNLHAADTISEAWDKINFNFDQLLLNGGGPKGPQGIKGPPGPIGGRGKRGSMWYEDETARPGTDPNNVTFLNLNEGDYYLRSDGQVWEYDGNKWVETIVNLMGSDGLTRNPIGPGGPSPGNPGPSGGPPGIIIGGFPIGISFYGDPPNEPIIYGEQSIYLSGMPSGKGALDYNANTNSGMVSLTVGAVPPGAQIFDQNQNPVQLPNTHFTLDSSLAKEISIENVSLLLRQKHPSISSSFISGGSSDISYAIKLMGSTVNANYNFEQVDLDSLTGIGLGEDDKLIIDIPKAASIANPTNLNDVTGLVLNTKEKGQEFLSGRFLNFETGNAASNLNTSIPGEFDFNINIGGPESKFTVSNNISGDESLFEVGGSITIQNNTTKSGKIYGEAGHIRFTSKDKIEFYSNAGNYTFSNLDSINNVIGSLVAGPNGEIGIRQFGGSGPPGSNNIGVQVFTGEIPNGGDGQVGVSVTEPKQIARWAKYTDGPTISTDAITLEGGNWFYDDISDGGHMYPKEVAHIGIPDNRIGNIYTGNISTGLTDLNFQNHWRIQYTQGLDVYDMAHFGAVPSSAFPPDNLFGISGTILFKSNNFNSYSNTSLNRTSSLYTIKNGLEASGGLDSNILIQNIQVSGITVGGNPPEPSINAWGNIEITTKNNGNTNLGKIILETHGDYDKVSINNNTYLDQAKALEQGPDIDILSSRNINIVNKYDYGYIGLSTKLINTSAPQEPHLFLNGQNQALANLPIGVSVPINNIVGGAKGIKLTSLDDGTDIISYAGDISLSSASNIIGGNSSDIIINPFIIDIDAHQNISMGFDGGLSGGGGIQIGDTNTAITTLLTQDSINNSRYSAIFMTNDDGFANYQGISLLTKKDIVLEIDGGDNQNSGGYMYFNSNFNHKAFTVSDLLSNGDLKNGDYFFDLTDPTDSTSSIKRFVLRYGNNVLPSGTNLKVLQIDSNGAVYPSTTNKTFVIQHPDKKNNYLVHACLEGPESAVYYRGESEIINGVSEIELPHYFESLTQKESRTVQITPFIDDSVEEPVIYSGNLYTGIIKDGKFKVYSSNTNESGQRFYWEVKAKRNDVPDLEVEPHKSHYKLKGDGPYTYLEKK